MAARVRPPDLEGGADGVRRAGRGFGVDATVHLINTIGLDFGIIAPGANIIGGKSIHGNGVAGYKDRVR